MSKPSTKRYRFGDLLALARQSWVTQMAAELERRGYTGYRRSDPAAVRLLRRQGPVSIGRLGDALGVSRQAARKLVTGLEARGLAQAVRDEKDGRQLNVQLTAAGRAYASALVEVIDELNHSLAQRVTLEQLTAADSVLRAALTDEHTRTLAAYLAPPARRRQANPDSPKPKSPNSSTKP